MSFSSLLKQNNEVFLVWHARAKGHTKCLKRSWKENDLLGTATMIMYVEQICGWRGLSEKTTTVQHLPQFALFLLSLEEQIYTETPLSGPGNYKTPSTTALALTEDEFHHPALAGPGRVSGQLIILLTPYA